MSTGGESGIGAADPVESLLTRLVAEGIHATTTVSDDGPIQRVLLGTGQSLPSRDVVRAIALEAGLKPIRIESQAAIGRSELLIASDSARGAVRAVEVVMKEDRESRHSPISRLVLSAGGFSIAVSGGDGAGKSTAVAMLEKWLAPTLDAVRLHFGRPAPLLVSSIVYRSFGILRRIGVDVPIPMLLAVGDVSRFGAGSKLALALQLLCLARDRRETHRRMRRLVGSGRIVLCDRYPDGRISDMDGPRLRKLWPGATGSKQRLIEFEERCYSGFTAPDLHLILRVTPAVALERQPKDDPASLEQRVRAVLQACEDTPDDVVVVDADRSVDVVHREIRDIVGGSL